MDVSSKNQPFQYTKITFNSHLQYESKSSVLFFLPSPSSLLLLVACLILVKSACGCWLPGRSCFQFQHHLWLIDGCSPRFPVSLLNSELQVQTLNCVSNGIVAPQKPSTLHHQHRQKSFTLSFGVRIYKESSLYRCLCVHLERASRQQRKSQKVFTSFIITT